MQHHSSNNYKCSLYFKIGCLIDGTKFFLNKYGRIYVTCEKCEFSKCNSELIEITKEKFEKLKYFI